MFKSIINYIGESDRRINVFSSISAIVAGLLFGLIIMIITNPADAPAAFVTILIGGFDDGLRSIGKVLFYATPIILTGLSVGFAFKTGLFNIGASGQLMVGAFVAIFVGVKWDFLPGHLHWVVALLLAGVAGAIWAIIPGLLKAYRNVHEVVSTIMMNYIGLYLVNFLVVQTVYNRLRNESMRVKPNAVIPTFGLNAIFGDKSVNAGFIIAILVVLIIWFVLNKTTFGFELKAVGYNKDASKYAGINEKRGIVFSMGIAGLLAGLAGGIIYLNNIDRNLEVVDVLVQEGFTGIPIALIGLSNPIGILFAGIFMGYIRQGGWAMQVYDLAPEIIDIIISSIIYFTALVLLFRGFIMKFYKRNKEQVVVTSGENEVKENG